MLFSNSTILSLLLLFLFLMMHVMDGGVRAANHIVKVNQQCTQNGGPANRKKVLNQLIEEMNGVNPLEGKEVKQANNYLNLAFCYKILGEETEATNNFQRAVNLHPDFLHEYAQFFGPVTNPNKNEMALPPPVLHQIDQNLKVGKHLLDADGEFLDPYMELDAHVDTNQLGTAMLNVGMENCNLIFAIDYTASNVWQGRWTFEGQNLHSPYIKNEDYESEGLNIKEMIEEKGRERPPAWMIKNAERDHPDAEFKVNPYEHVIHLMGQTLDKPEFDADGLIPAFGFGNFRSKGSGCFNLKTDALGNRQNNWNIRDFYTDMAAQSCWHFQEVLTMYETKTPHMHLSGPTNIGPVIRQAIEIVKKVGTYHILVIVADGQVEPAGSVEDSIKAIVEASKHPLSIVLIGVGDGPWHTMIDFDDNLMHRGSDFDNFQFVNFHEIVEQTDNPEASFAYYTLEEVNTQYTYIKDNILPHYKKHPQPPLPSRYNSRMQSFNQRPPMAQGRYPPQQPMGMGGRQTSYANLQSQQGHGIYGHPQQNYGQPGMQRPGDQYLQLQNPQSGMGNSNAANVQTGRVDSHQARANNIWQ